MRLFSQKLLGLKGSRVKNSNWSTPTAESSMFYRFSGYENDLYGIKSSNVVYKLNSSLNWVQMGTANTAVSGGKLFAYGQNVIVMSYRGDGYYYQRFSHSRDSGSTWSNEIKFSSYSKFNGCYFNSAIPINREWVSYGRCGWLFIGYKIINNERKGISCSYYYDQYDEVYKFGDVFTYETNILTSGGYDNEGNTYLIGDNGYVTKESSYYATQIDQAQNWEYIAYGNNTIMVLSSSGYCSFSKDEGYTWSSPVYVGTSSIYGLTFAYNKFVILCLNYIISTFDGINFYKSSNLSKNYDYIQYVYEKILLHNGEYKTYKTYGVLT